MEGGCHPAGGVGHHLLCRDGAVAAAADALSTRNEQLQQQYAALDQKNRDLREELTYVATDAYIEETARNEFGYVRDGEIHFHFASMDVLRGYTEAEWNALLDEFRD